MKLLADIKEMGTTGILNEVKNKEVNPRIAYFVLQGRYGKGAQEKIEKAISKHCGYIFKL